MQEEPKKPEAQNGQNQFDLNACTPEQFLDKLKNDKELMEEYMNSPNDPKFQKINSLLNNKGNNTVQTPQPETQVQNADTQAQTTTVPVTQKPDQLQTEEIDLTGVKIPKNVLSKHLSDNKSTSEALINALKEAQEKEKIIESFRAKNDMLINDSLNLKKQLMSVMQNNSSPQLEGLLEAVKEVNFDILNNVDPFDPEQHSKIEDAKKELEKLKKTINEVTEKYKTSKADPTLEINKIKQGIEQTVIQKEFADIEALQQEHPELQTPVPFFVLDTAIANFQKSVADLNGTPYNVEAALTRYFSENPEGEKFRSLCKSCGIELPDGYETWAYIVGKIRPLRLQNIEKYKNLIKSKTGRDLEPMEVLDAPGISYRELYKVVGPFKPPKQAVNVSPSPKMQQTIERHIAEDKQLQSFVPEIPPSMGKPVETDVMNITEKELNQLLGKLNNNPSALTEDEAKKLESVYNFAGVPVHEIVKRKLKK